MQLSRGSGGASPRYEADIVHSHGQPYGYCLPRYPSPLVISLPPWVAAVGQSDLGIAATFEPLELWFHGKKPLGSRGKSKQAVKAPAVRGLPESENKQIVQSVITRSQALVSEGPWEWS